MVQIIINQCVTLKIRIKKTGRVDSFRFKF
jgi:hypothetical protein